MKKGFSFCLCLSLALVATVLFAGMVGAAGNVVVYTAHHADIVNQVVPLFEQQTGIRVQLVRAGSGEIIQRVVAEGQRPQGDVIWSIGIEPLEGHAHLLEHYTPTEVDSLDPGYMLSPHWLPYTGLPLVVLANTDLVSAADMPTTWADLADPKWNGKVAFAGADVSGSSYMILVTILNIYGEEEGWDLVERIMGNSRVLASSGQVPRGVADGEYALGLTMEEVANRYLAGGAPVAIVYPEDGTSAMPDGCALIKGGPNPENGKAFLDFVLSKEVQEFLVNEMQRRSVRNDVAPPGALPELSELVIKNYDLHWAVENRNTIIRRWQSIIRQ